MICLQGLKCCGALARGWWPLGWGPQALEPWGSCLKNLHQDSCLSSIRSGKWWGPPLCRFLVVTSSRRDWSPEICGRVRESSTLCLHKLCKGCWHHSISCTSDSNRIFYSELGKTYFCLELRKNGCIGGRSKKPILSFPTRDPSEVKWGLHTGKRSRFGRDDG